MKKPAVLGTVGFYYVLKSLCLLNLDFHRIKNLKLEDHTKSKKGQKTLGKQWKDICGKNGGKCE